MASAAPRVALLAFGVAVAIASCTLTTELPDPASATGAGGLGGGGDPGQGGGGGTGAQGGGGAGGLGGSGGEGGAVPVTAPDWIGSFEAVFRFDQSDLATDATGNYADFVATGAPVFDQGQFVQGQGAMRVSRAQANGLRRLSGVLPLESYTIGGWFYVEEMTPPQDIAFVFSDAPVGYYLEREVSTSEPRCYHATEATLELVAGAAPWRPQEWRHVTCQYDAVAQQLSIFVDGVLADIHGGVPPISYEPGELLIPDFDQPYDGNMDEVFFSDAVLPSDAILRIWTCGIDGARCTCSTEEPAQYEQCGVLDDCSALPPCDRPAP